MGTGKEHRTVYVLKNVLYTSIADDEGAIYTQITEEQWNNGSLLQHICNFANFFMLNSLARTH